MSKQRTLRLAGVVLFALTVVCMLIVPHNIVPTKVTVILVALSALAFLLAIFLGLKSDHTLGGWIKALLYASLVLILVGGVGMGAFPNDAAITNASQGEEFALSGRGMDGYTLSIEKVNRASTQDASVQVVLTRPDQISIHEEITTTKPMVYDGIEIHPLTISQSGVDFLVSHYVSRNIIKFGGILFLISLGLTALPFVRRRGDGV